MKEDYNCGRGLQLKSWRAKANRQDTPALFKCLLQLMGSMNWDTFLQWVDSLRALSCRVLKMRRKAPFDKYQVKQQHAVTPAANNVLSNKRTETCATSAFIGPLTHVLHWWTSVGRSTAIWLRMVEHKDCWETAVWVPCSRLYLSLTNPYLPRPFQQVLRGFLDPPFY